MEFGLIVILIIVLVMSYVIGRIYAMVSEIQYWVRERDKREKQGGIGVSDS